MARAEDFQHGDKVFIDSFAGLVPAVVVSTKSAVIDRLGQDRSEVTVRVTETRGAYKKGMVESHSPKSIVKREWVHKKGYHHVIREPFRPPGKWVVQELQPIIGVSPPIVGASTFSNETEARRLLDRYRERGVKAQLMSPEGRIVNPTAAWLTANPFGRSD